MKNFFVSVSKNEFSCRYFFIFCASEKHVILSFSASDVAHFAKAYRSVNYSFFWFCRTDFLTPFFAARVRKL